MRNRKLRWSCAQCGTTVGSRRSGFVVQERGVELLVKQTGGDNVAHREGDFEVVQRQVGQLVFDGGCVVRGHDKIARVVVPVAACYRDQGHVSAVAVTERTLNR